MRTAAMTGCLLALAVAGCGEQSEEDQVRDVLKQYAADARGQRYGDACAATTNPRACLDEVATAQALGVNPATLVPSDGVLDRAKIVVRGNRATVDATAAEDATYVKRDGRWLSLWDDDE